MLTQIFSNKNSEQGNSGTRENLFKMQTLIVTALLGLMSIAFFHYNQMNIQNHIKLLFAPFLSVVPLLFILTILKDLKKGFKEEAYTRQDIVKYSMLALIIAVVFIGVTHLLNQLDALEILIAAVIAILSGVLFVKSRVRGLLGMSLITGIAEGIIVFMIFLF